MTTPSSATETGPAKPYDVWAKAKTPKNLRAVIDDNRPTIDKALKSYAGGMPGNNIRRRAELMAAEAVKTYDPQVGAQLHTHMMSQLQGLRRVAAKFADPMPKPDRLRLESAKMEADKLELADVLGREPSLEELAEHGGYDARKIRKMQMRNRATVAESSLIPEDGNEGDEYMPGVRRNDPAAVWMDYVYHDLDDIGRIILQYRTGYNGVQKLSNQDIAKRLNMTPAAVSKRANQIQARLDEIVEA